MAFNAGAQPQTLRLGLGQSGEDEAAGIETWEALGGGAFRLPGGGERGGVPEFQPSRDGCLELPLGPFGSAVLRRRVRKGAPA
ncbi:hypothetical protein [Cohnella rhizosphaerae]|uniref:hypothetical protein n=1 Tax=Cohnella rhizosphaerae TaxID=1457232 RepID=UPI0030B904DC